MPKPRSVQIGQQFKSNSHGIAVVTAWNSTTDIEIKFLETGHTSNTSSYQLKNGKFCDPVLKAHDQDNLRQARNAKAQAKREAATKRKREVEARRVDREAEKAARNDRNRPTVFGVGYLGYGPYQAYISKSKPTQHYQIWRAMLNRCYRKNPDGTHVKPAYSDCTVNDAWHNFQNFAKWYNENYPAQAQPGEYQLDKDIKVKGNTVYSESTCMFVTARENQAARRGHGTTSP